MPLLMLLFVTGVISFVYPVFCSFADSIRQLRILAGAVREIERDLRIPLYLSNTSPLTRGESLRRDITANRVVWDNIVRAIPVRPLIATSIGCAVVCVRAGIVRVSIGM